MLDRRPTRFPVHATLLTIVKSLVVPVAMICVLLFGRCCMAERPLGAAVRTELRDPVCRRVCFVDGPGPLPLSVYLTSNGDIDLDGELVGDFHGLRTALFARLASREEKVVIEAEPERSYGDLMATVEAVRMAGVKDLIVRLHREWSEELPTGLNTTNAQA